MQFNSSNDEEGSANIAQVINGWIIKAKWWGIST